MLDIGVGTFGMCIHVSVYVYTSQFDRKTMDVKCEQKKREPILALLASETY